MTITPTEALLQVARSSPRAPAVSTGTDTWSYAQLWARVRELARQINLLDSSGAPVGLYMGLEIDYVAGSHAIWLSGRTLVVLSTNWTSSVLKSILKRTKVQVVLFGNTSPSADLPVSSVCTFDFVPTSPSSNSVVPSSSEFVEIVPIICSITPTSGSTGVPKSIVYPMGRSLSVLDEESSTLLKHGDGQWLRGGTTFLRPLFEIRRFMFNQTTLYLDPTTSVADQCMSFCEELENPSNSQLLRAHFTPSVFRAFADYVKMKYGPTHSFIRLYWLVIGGESLTVADIALAQQIFPQATVACNYACSEVGFAGVCQMFVRPGEPVPEVVNFDATQGCEDLVLLDDDDSVIPEAEGASGIVGIVSTSTATHYIGNEEASEHVFRSWGGDRILLYTDDIGSMAADGRISINGRRSRNVKINGLFVDLDYIETAMADAFDGEVMAYKLVKSGERIVLFWTGESSNVTVLRLACNTLRKKLGNNLAMVLSSARHIEEMPYNASYKVDLVKLQSIADEEERAVSPVIAPIVTVFPPKSRSHEIADEIAVEVAKLTSVVDPIATDVSLTLVGLNSITVVQLYFFLQEGYQYDDDMSRLFADDATAMNLAREITGELQSPVKAARFAAEQKFQIKVDIVQEDEVTKIAVIVAAEVAKLSQSTEPIPIDTPLMLAGLNSITVIQLYFWLQSEYDYEEDMSRLFEPDVSAKIVAQDITGAAEASSPSSDVPMVAHSVPGPRRVVKRPPPLINSSSAAEDGWTNAIFGLLAYTLMSPSPVPTSARRPPLSPLTLTVPSSDMVDSLSPISPWVSEGHSPSRMLCV